MRLTYSWKKWLRGLLALGFLGLTIFPSMVASAEDDDVRGAKAPGNCTWPDYKKLKRDVAEKCNKPENRPQKCESHHICAQLEDFARRFRECIVARETLSDRCFGGGDNIHHDEIKNLEKGKKNCNDMLEECRKKEKNQCPN